MRTFVVILLSAGLLAGCTNHKQTIETGNGPATVTESNNNQTVTVQGKEGTAVFGKGAVDAAKIGLPIYPGAASAENAGYAATTKEGTGKVVLMTTSDSFDKVFAWYKDHLPAGSEQMHLSAGGGSMAVFKVGKESDKEQKIVQLTSSKGQTSIMLTSGTKQ